MELEQAFLQDIREHPDDPSLWWILADWLEDQNDPRAELVRLTQLLRSEPEHPEFDLRQRRVQTLLAEGLLPLVPTLTNSIGMPLALIPAGAFLMGSPESEEGRRPHETIHPVRLTRPFFMGIFPVTQGEYEKVLGANPSLHQRGANHPVENVNWHEAEVFCERLSELPGERAAGRTYRLPTEAEWEYACRAGTRTVFHFGDHIGAEHARFNSLHPYGKARAVSMQEGTAPVGGYPPNAWGLYDMHGNVVCWCQDWWGDLGPQEAVDPVGPDEGSYRIVRGGAWCFHGVYSRAAYRNHSSPGSQREFYGIRVVSPYTVPG